MNGPFLSERPWRIKQRWQNGVDGDHHGIPSHGSAWKGAAGRFPQQQTGCIGFCAFGFLRPRAGLPRG